MHASYKIKIRDPEMERNWRNFDSNTAVDKSSFLVHTISLWEGAADHEHNTRYDLEDDYSVYPLTYRKELPYLG